MDTFQTVQQLHAQTAAQTDPIVITLDIGMPIEGDIVFRRDKEILNGDELYMNLERKVNGRNPLAPGSRPRHKLEVCAVHEGLRT